MPETINIVIGGDICPTNDTKSYFDEKNYEALITDVKGVIDDADISIFNLECPFVDYGQKSFKTGPVLRSPTSYFEFFKYLKVTALALGNNHIKDCGEQGVISTLDLCKKSDIGTVGAGINNVEAKKPLVIKEKGFKVGFLSYAEHEFNLAKEREAGANHFDMLYDFDRIKDLKSQVDYLIVLYHGGIEHYAYPSPLLQKKCRKMIEVGADLVTCQHSHIIGTEEVYQGGYILYGQGNMIYGYRKHDASWNKGVLIKIVLSKDGKTIACERSLVPFEATKTSNIRLMSREESSSLFSEMKKRASNIKNGSYVRNEWWHFCDRKKALYLPQLLGKGRGFNKLNRILGNRLINLIFSRRSKIITKNIIRCESHNEVLATILEFDQ